MRVQMRWAALGFRCPRCGVTVCLPKYLDPVYCPACRDARSKSERRMIRLFERFGGKRFRVLRSAERPLRRWTR